MPSIRPFRGLCPDPARAAEVIAPPYDVLSSAEARARAAGAPLSFLHVSRPEIDLPAETLFDASVVYDRGASNFRALIGDGILRQDETDSFYVYRLETDGHMQTGLVATVSVADYEANHIRKHELTRPDKEDDRARHIEALGAQTGPVLLVYLDDAGAAQLMADYAARKPEHERLTLDGVSHSLWRVSGFQDKAALRRIFDPIPTFYIADGHHRSAAAARVAADRRAEPEDAAYYFLSVLFPANEMRILDYNRVVQDLNGLPVGAFLEAVGKRFLVTPEKLPVAPRGHGEFGMYLDGRWYRLNCRVERRSLEDPIERLDVSLLTSQLIEPVLGISDPRRDRRIDFVGGIRGLHELEQRVDSGAMAVAFSLYPTPLADLMAVADAGRVMPPKSTWFEPKLADGLVSHLIGSG